MSFKSYREECDAWDRASESERLARLKEFFHVSGDDKEIIRMAKTPGSVYFHPELECYKSPTTKHDWVFPLLEDSIDKNRNSCETYCRYCFELYDDGEPWGEHHGYDR